MRKRRSAVLLLSALLGTISGLAAQQSQAAAGPERWEPEIQAFEAADRETPPGPGGVVFVGSSSIRFWRTLPEDFPTLAPLNRGFGGSRISDVRHFADRLILAYRPRLVVLYAGDNDLGFGRTPQAVFEDYRAIAELVRKELPETRLVFIAIKPSPRRWEQANAMREANALIAEYASRDPQLGFVDVFEPMLGPDGLPRPELYVEDGLHMTPEGYRVWREVVGPHLLGAPISSGGGRRLLGAALAIAGR